MNIGVIISLITLALSVVGSICSFAFFQGKNENRLKVLEEKQKRNDDYSEKINKMEQDIVEIKTTLSFIRDKIN